jgi:hypothetical protein
MLQVNVTADPDAFTVSSAPGATFVSLVNDVKAAPCSESVSATWAQCGDDIADGQGCTLLDIPCPTAIASAAPTALSISCPDNAASQAPISFPTSTTLHVDLMYDDGQRRALRYPPPNNGSLQIDVQSGSNSCLVDYNGSAAPNIRAASGASCTYQTCQIQVTYAAPCRAAPILRSAEVWVVNAICLQPEIACPNATEASLGPPNGSLTCSSVSTDLRPLACAAAGYQQRTIWVDALLSPQPGLPNGVLLSLMHLSCLQPISCKHAT